MPRRDVLLLLTLLVGYGSFYFCRANLDAAGPLLIAHQGFDKTSFGTLSAIATFSYAVGKFLMGATGDVLGGRRLFGVAVAGSVVCSLAFGVSNTFILFAIFAATNRFFQSGGWSAIVHVVSRRFEPGRHGMVMGVIATSYELGNVAALNLSGFLAQFAEHHDPPGWRVLFIVNPILFALIGGGVWLALRAPEAPVSGKPAPPPEPKLPLSEILPTLFKRGSFWVAVVMSALLTFVRTAFLNWTPTYLYEISKAAGHEDISGSIVKSSLFPAAGVIAALTVGILSDRFGPGRRAPVMAVSLTVVVGLVLLLGHGGIQGTTPAALLIAAIGLFLLGPYSMLAGVVALDVAGKRGTATATGMIDGAGYLAGTASGLFLGAIADAAGWSAVFDRIAGAAALAAIVSGAWAVVVMRRRK